MTSSLTSSEKYSRATPTGINNIPIIKKVGRTVPAVKTGCQAGKRCCLKAESMKRYTTYYIYTHRK